MAINNISCPDAFRGSRPLYLYNESQIPPRYLFNPMLTSMGCGSVLVPVSVGNRSMDVEHLLEVGFPLTWPRFIECELCQNNNVRCGYDGTSKKIICLCKSSCRK